MHLVCTVEVEQSAWKVDGLHERSGPCRDDYHYFSLDNECPRQMFEGRPVNNVVAPVGSHCDLFPGDVEDVP